jgi:putative membrane protein
MDILSYGWNPMVTATIAVVAILTGGVAFALLTVLIPGFAKFFLSDFRAEVEVRQYAESLFLSRELFATSKRTGILILVSLFERKVVILPDTGLRDILSKDTLQTIITAMAPFLKRSEISRAFETGLEQLTKILGNKVLGTDKNELSDDIIEEKGV